jgi:hypothetical protein
MISLIGGMLAIALTWLILFLVVCGLGLSLQRLFGSRIRDAEDGLLSFWAGWALLLGFLQIFHFFLPVNSSAFIIIAILGTLGIVWNFKTIFSLRRSWSAAALVFAAAVCCFAWWLANRAMGPITLFDAGLYHISAIRWDAAYPLVTGLGNLQGRLAFNNSSFLYFAFLNVGPWADKFQVIGNGLLLLVAAMQFGLSTWKMVFRREDARPFDLARIFLGVPLVQLLFLGPTNTAPDTATTLLSIVVSAQMCKMLFSKSSRGDSLWDVVLLVLLASAGITVKISFAAFAALAIVIAVGKRALDNAWRLKTDWRAGGWIAGAVCLLLVPWVIRNVLLSGYLVYPVSGTAVNVDWRIPDKQTAFDFVLIQAHARNPDPSLSAADVMSNWNWLIPWIEKTVLGEEIGVDLPILLSLAGILYLFFRRRDASRPGLVRAIFFILPALGAVLYWFFTAPETRFLGAYFWIIAAGILAVAYEETYSETRLPSRALLAIALCAFAFGNQYGLHGAFVRPGPDHGFNNILRVEVKPFTTDSGLILSEPTVGNQCWDSGLLCTPSPEPGLQLRQPNDLRSGFRIVTKE